MHTNYPYPAEAPKPIQSDADLLLDANLGDFDRAIVQAKEFQAVYSDLHDSSHWWLVELRLKSMQRNLRSSSDDSGSGTVSDTIHDGNYS